MNKLDGFFRLKELNIPTVPFRIFEDGDHLSPDKLWTLRTAIYSGKDFNLPRAIGVSREEGESFAADFIKRYRDNGIVIYYPYFIAEKSGTFLIRNNGSVIEGVKGDLWHLVTEGKRDITLFFGEEIKEDTSFFTEEEINQLNTYEKKIRQMFYSDISIGKEVLLEWSFAYESDLQKQPTGNKYLVFYELRIT